MAGEEKARALTATQSFVAEVDGESVLIVSGQRIRADHPLVEGREALFAEPEAEVIEKGA
jgi:hypothetical protein